VYQLSSLTSEVTIAAYACSSRGRSVARLPLAHCSQSMVR